MAYNPLSARRAFRRELARQTPLIDGRETRLIARKIHYNADRAHEIIGQQVVPFDPRNSFRDRLLAELG